MTTFVLSHNLQVQADDVPPLSADQLAAGLKRHEPTIQASEALSHPHWMLKLESELEPEPLAQAVATAWKALRQELGQASMHTVMALGGRKDSEASPGAPLQQGSWGVDVVETADAQAFLDSINWSALKAGRPEDGVFEVVVP